MDDEPIHVIVEGEDDDAAGSSAQRIAALNRQADADRAYAARTRRETAQLQRDSALRKIDADRLTVESETKAAESAYRNAREFGDVDGEVAATKRLSAAQSRHHLLETQRSAVERAPISSGDPVEDSLAGYTEKTAAWLRSNPEYLTDPSKSAKARGAHFMAVSEGLDPDSPEYFEHCERTLGLRRGGGRNNGARSSPTVAPVRGDTGANSYGGNSMRGQTVALTKGEVERANDGSVVWNVGNTDSRGNVIRHGDPRVGKPVGNSEYARRKIELSKQGYYERI
jgi:hypothetical protein